MKEISAIPAAGVRKSRLPSVVLTFLLGLGLYAATAAPGVDWQDSATFQSRVWHFDIRGDHGLALAHPLYTILAWLFTRLPLGNFAHRVNLFSAVTAAAALAIAFDLLRSITASRLAAATGAILLGVSHTFWRHAVMAEVYSLYGMLFLLELRLVELFVRRRSIGWLAGAAFVNGLGVSNHLLAMLHWPAYVVFLVWAGRSGRLSWRGLPLLVGALVIGAAPYLGLIVSDIREGHSALATLRSALFGEQYQSRVLNSTFSFVRSGPRVVEYFALNFPTPLVFAAPLGFVAAWRSCRTRWFAGVLAVCFVVDFVFAFRYPVPDQYVFFFTCYIVTALLAAMSVAPRDALYAPAGHAKPAPKRAPVSAGRASIFIVLAILPAFVYEVAPAVARRLHVNLGVQRELAGRDTYAFFLRPRRNGDHSAERYARGALDRASPDGLLIADSTIDNVLVYVRDVEGYARGVTLTRTSDFPPAAPAIHCVPEAIKPFVARGNAFSCSDLPGYTPQEVLAEFRLTPDGDLFRLLPREN